MAFYEGVYRGNKAYWGTEANCCDFVELFLYLSYTRLFQKKNQ